MKLEELIKKTSNLPCFTIGFLLAGQNVALLRPQVNRWVKDRKLIKLHKGFYTLAEPYRRMPLEPFAIAGKLKTPSYISLQSALAFHGMIPEYVPQITSVTTGRPQTIETPLGRFDFRHINKKHFHGFSQVTLSAGQTAFIACPEKALLDLVHLTAGGDKQEFIRQLRLQNLEKMDNAVLWKLAQTSNSPKLKRACEYIQEIVDQGEGMEL